MKPTRALFTFDPAAAARFRDFIFSETGRLPTVRVDFDRAKSGQARRRRGFVVEVALPRSQVTDLRYLFNEQEFLRQRGKTS